MGFNKMGGYTGPPTKKDAKPAIPPRTTGTLSPVPAISQSAGDENKSRGSQK